jgi:hypothetical protein
MCIYIYIETRSIQTKVLNIEKFHFPRRTGVFCLRKKPLQYYTERKEKEESHL